MSPATGYTGPDRRAPNPDEVRMRRMWIRLIIGQAVIVVILIASIWISSWQGRSNVVDTQRNGCERGKLDRRANAQGWRTAEAARRLTAENPDAEAQERRSAAIAARAYKSIADALDERSRLDCEKAFPAPKLLEFAASPTNRTNDETYQVAIDAQKEAIASAIAAAEVEGERIARTTLGGPSDNP